ncbi:MAG: hypothetical protein DLM59_02230 [Pseudonocardiales bacterium]|nr:MAG: hypothetical protein DLM59_02230 [Pseudonocardiales bacterium]
MAVTLAKHVPSGTVPGASAPADDRAAFAVSPAGSAWAGAVQELVWTDMAMTAAVIVTTAAAAGGIRNHLLSIRISHFAGFADHPIL